MVRRSQKTGQVQMIFVSSTRITLDGQVWPEPYADQEITKREKNGLCQI